MIAALTLAASAPVLTAQEAQTLPVAEIAARVLGAAGAVVVDVERPTWPTCYGLCPPPTPKPEGPPPLAHLVFYTRATASAWAGWAGLCAASRIEVTFDPAGQVTAVEQVGTIGSAGALVPLPDATAAVATQDAAMQVRCRSLATTAAFFRAPDRLAAWRAAIAIELVHAAMLRPGGLKVGCKSYDIGITQDCGSPEQLADFAERVTIAHVGDVDPDPKRVPAIPADPACFAVRLNQQFGQAEQVNVCVDETKGPLRVTRADIVRSRVVY